MYASINRPNQSPPKTQSHKSVNPPIQSLNLGLRRELRELAHVGRVVRPQDGNAALYDGRILGCWYYVVMSMWFVHNKGDYCVETQPSQPTAIAFFG